MALLKKLSLNILSIAILLIFLFGLFVFYIFNAELKPVIQKINLTESIAIPNIMLTHNTFHEVESGENMTVIFEKYKIPKNEPVPNDKIKEFNKLISALEKTVQKMK
tara:strand:+ start:5 stop:325 length:321 start_codon:yes stop_codon:yes gene_type:complete